MDTPTTGIPAALLPELPAPPLAGPGRWSVSLQDVTTGRVLHEEGAREVLPTASVAKVFVLTDLAARITAGELDPDALVDRRDVAPVAGTGTWQHLRTDRLTLRDAAVLVATTSDNLATNVLLHRLGLDRVRARAAELVPGGSTLHDVVRDVRTAVDPPTLSTGCAADWAGLMADLSRGTCVDRPTSRLVRQWLALTADRSLVASVIDTAPDTPLFHKTGTDRGVRADVGVLGRGPGAVAYACLCAWDHDASPDAVRGVVERMRALGEFALG